MFSQACLRQPEFASNSHKSAIPVRRDNGSLRDGRPSRESRVRSSVISLPEEATGCQRRSGYRITEHDPIFIDDHEPTGTRGISQGPNVNAEFSREFLKRPESTGVIEGSERSCFLQSGLGHEAPS